MIVRLGLAAIVLSALGAGEERARTVVGQFSMEAGSIDVAINRTAGADPSRIFGGAKLWYGGIFFHADAIAWRSALIDGRELPVWAEMLPGPAGPDPHRVRLDTTACTLPTMLVRTRVDAAQIGIDRLPDDPARPGAVQLQLSVRGAGAFEAQFRKLDVWYPYAIWAKRMELFLEIPRGSTDLALREIQLLGEDQPPRRRARIENLDPQFAAEARPWVESRLLRIPVDALGNPARIIGEKPDGTAGVSGRSMDLLFAPFVETSAALPVPK